MTTRMLSLDDACWGVKVPFGRARHYKGTTVTVDDPLHVRALREAGYTVADTSGPPVRKAAGFECTACSFQSYFKKCSRCGSACDRPDLVA